MPGTKPQYPPEFKTEAIRLVHSSGRSISQVAKELGVSDNALRNWVRQAEIDGGKREEKGVAGVCQGLRNPLI